MRFSSWDIKLSRLDEGCLYIDPTIIFGLCSCKISIQQDSASLELKLKSDI